MLLYRLSHLAWMNGRRKTGRLLMQLNSMATGADLIPESDLGEGLLIPSPCGVRISGRVGRNLTVLSLSGTGGNVLTRDVGAGPGQPVVGDHVRIGPFAGVLGGVRVGDGVLIGPGAWIYKDTASDSRVVAAEQPIASRRPWRAPSRIQASPGKAPPACAHADWSRSRADFDADIDRYRGEAVRHAGPGQAPTGRLSARLTNPGLALGIYRRSHWHHANGRPRRARALAGLNWLLFKLSIHPASCIGGGLLMPHIAGTVFCGHAGARLTLYTNALCEPGADTPDPDPSYGPNLGDDVTIGAHSGIFGSVRIGCRVSLAPKVHVTQDIADDIQVFSPLARSRETRGAGAGVGATEPATPASRLTWAETRRRLARDRERRAAFAAGSVAICTQLHRLSHHFFAAGALRRARWCWLANAWLTGADLSPASEIGPGLLIPHPAGVAVHARAGGDLTLLAQSGTGPAADADGLLPPLALVPILGSGVCLSPHSGLYGAVTAGDRVTTQPGCILQRDIPTGARFAPPQLRLRRRPPSVSA